MHLVLLLENLWLENHREAVSYFLGRSLLGFRPAPIESAVLLLQKC